MPRQRLGVALLFDEPVRSELLGLRRALGTPSLATQPPHLTLVPPVNVRDSDLTAALGVIRTAAAHSGLLRLELGPARTFLPVSPVAYLAVDGDVDRLTALRDAVLRGPLRRQIDHPFVPHVTLHEDASPELAASAVAALHAYGVEVTIASIHLLREGPGHVWAPIADARLEEPAVRGRGGVEVAFRRARMRAPDVRALFAETSTAAVAGRNGAEPWVLEAWEGTELAGAAMGTAADGQWVVMALAVAPGSRGRGVGTRLLDEVIAQAAAAGTGVVGVLVPPEGPDVPTWVASRGFVARHPRANQVRWLALPRG
jgi:2'-5' RNA ligase